MTKDQIKNQMQNITIGNTSVVCDIPVTRWSKESWEVKTFGKETTNTDMAINTIIFHAISKQIGI